MLLSDKTIRKLCEEKGMIDPYFSGSVSKLPDGRKISSKGSSSYGYDMSLGNTFRMMKVPDHTPADARRVIDPCNFDPSFYEPKVHVPNGHAFILPPGRFSLGVSENRIKMPVDVSAICMQKSTIARSNLVVEVTPLEAGWEGYVTLEIRNPSAWPVRLTPGMGIMQILFFKGDLPCAVSYATRGGKYQDQPAEPVIPRQHIAEDYQPSLDPAYHSCSPHPMVA